MILVLVTCNAQKVEINCIVGYTGTQLSCSDYTVTPSERRNVSFIGPTPETYEKVKLISLKHPALHYFLIEVFDLFPNLQALYVNIDGSAVLPQFGFQKAKNLEVFEVSKNTFDTLDGYVFYGAIKLKSITMDSVLRIDENAFYGLSNLDSLYISFSDVGYCSISNKAFNPLVNLKTLNFFNIELATVPASLFANNLRLESIGIYDDLQAVESTFIDHLDNLKSIYLSGSTNGCSAQWTFPNPISDFHLAMASCYGSYTN